MKNRPYARSRTLACCLALGLVACSTSSSSTWQDGGIQSSQDAASSDASVPLDAAIEPDARSGDDAAVTKPTPLRVATYNLADVRSESLADGSDAKLKRIAATIQRVAPDILFVNELAYDQAGQNGQRFADLYLGVSQGDGLLAVSYRAVMRPSNTGVPSGFDLDRTGGVVSEVGSGYGGDCWGYGDFVGQYALAILVREDLTVRDEAIRTFQLFKWSALPDAIRPKLPDGSFWYADDVWAELRLSSKTHMDVPVVLADGRELHLLASHPTPPSFDGNEDRNGARNHDELRFWSEYLDDAPFLVDDEGSRGGLPPGASFVIAGDMNADPDEGDSYGDPMTKWLLSNPKVNARFTPVASSQSDAQFGRATDPDDTASFGLRVDYVLPSADLTVLDGAVERVAASSDHAMVWLDLAVP